MKKNKLFIFIIILNLIVLCNVRAHEEFTCRYISDVPLNGDFFTGYSITFEDQGGKTMKIKNCIKLNSFGNYNYTDQSLSEKGESCYFDEVNFSIDTTNLSCPFMINVFESESKIEFHGSNNYTSYDSFDKSDNKSDYYKENGAVYNSFYNSNMMDCIYYGSSTKLYRHLKIVSNIKFGTKEIYDSGKQQMEKYDISAVYKNFSWQKTKSLHEAKYINANDHSVLITSCPSASSDWAKDHNQLKQEAILPALEANDIKSNSCYDYRSSTSCQNKSDNVSCVWVENELSPYGGFCNVDNLLYVGCGDASDIPIQVPALISFAVNLLKILTPIILIFVSIISLLKALSSQKEDEIKKATSSLVRKMIAAAFVFFVIGIVQFIVSKAASDKEYEGFENCLDCFLNNQCKVNTYYKTVVAGEDICTELATGISKECDKFFGNE